MAHCTVQYIIYYYCSKSLIHHDYAVSVPTGNGIYRTSQTDCILVSESTTQTTYILIYRYLPVGLLYYIVYIYH